MNKPLPRSKYGKAFGENYEKIFGKVDEQELKSACNEAMKACPQTFADTSIEGFIWGYCIGRGLSPRDAAALTEKYLFGKD